MDKLKAAKAYNKAHPGADAGSRRTTTCRTRRAQAGKEPDFIDWLLSGNRLQVMELFLTAPYNPWTGYRGPRSYGWHHRRLKDFYSRVFPGE